MMMTGNAGARRLPIRCRRGAVMMEYVVIAVLIAVACIIAVVVFNRSIIRSSDVAAKAATGRGSRAGEAAQTYQADTEADIKEAEKFPGKLSDASD